MYHSLCLLTNSNYTRTTLYHYIVLKHMLLHSDSHNILGNLGVSYFIRTNIFEYENNVNF